MKNNFVWNRQSEYDIFDSINDWDYHRFACIMQDNKLAQFAGMWDENLYGERNLYIYDVDDVYKLDDIVMWIEIPNISK